jgi:hypothetical protein
MGAGHSNRVVYIILAWVREVTFFVSQRPNGGSR